MIHTDIFWYSCICSIESFKKVEFANCFPFSIFTVELWLCFHFSSIKQQTWYLSCYTGCESFFIKGHISPIIFVIRWSLTLQATRRKSCNFNMNFFLWIVYFVAEALQEFAATQLCSVKENVPYLLCKHRQNQHSWCPNVTEGVVRNLNLKIWKNGALHVKFFLWLIEDKKKEKRNDFVFELIFKWGRTYFD